MAPGIALARAENTAWVLFEPGVRPQPEHIYAALRAAAPTASNAEIDAMWDLVQVRLAELQAAADGFPVKQSINERAA